MSKTLLLHTCCAPCAAGCVEMLQEQSYRVILFFANSNIDTEEEFQRRFEAVQSLARIYQLELHLAPYDHQAWRRQMVGFEQEPEGGARCPRCFAFSLAQTAEKCRQLGNCEFSTSLTVSPHKNSQLILQVGGTFENFAPFNFKKQDGFRRSRILARRHNFYLQDFCGCEFSRRAL